MTAVTVGRTPRHDAVVVAAHSLTPRMRRLTLSCNTMTGLPLRPAQDVELVLSERDGRRAKRRYTIRNAEPERGRFDVDALLHGSGPGARWAAGTQVGAGVSLFGPRGRLELRAAEWHLFVGDESALPAIAELAAALPAGTPAIAIVEVGDASDELPVGMEPTWVHRDGDPPGHPDRLAAALAARHALPGTGRAYLFGESRAIVALRPHVEALGVPRERTYVKGYWNRGRARITP